MWNKIKTFVNHERYEVIAMVVAMAVLVWAYGCESHVRSLLNPSEKVTRSELEIEIDTFLKTAEIRYGQLDRLDQLKRTIFEHALLWSQTGVVNPWGMVTAIAGILGVGATVDNVRKRKTIRTNLTNYVNTTKGK